MTSLRKRKATISRAYIRRRRLSALEDRLWDQMRPVGREFGSPDFERLMEQDRSGGVSDIEIPEELPVQHRGGL